MNIRPALVTDLERIHALSIQLGYSPSLPLVRQNLEAMLGHPDCEVVVGTTDDGSVLGWMSLATRLRIEDEPFLEVTALVVDEQTRGTGAGKKLVAYAVASAKKNKLPFVALRSRTSRKEAHGFYEHLGFHKLKESYFFRKDL